MGFFQAVTDTLGYWSSAMVYGLLAMAAVFGLVLFRALAGLILSTAVLVAATALALWWLGYLPV